MKKASQRIVIKGYPGVRGVVKGVMDINAAGEKLLGARTAGEIETVLATISCSSKGQHVVGKLTRRSSQILT